MKESIRQGAASLWYWKLAIIRCLIYGTMVGWGVFKAGVEGFEALNDMTVLQMAKLAGDMGMGFLGVMLAFLDNTIQRLAGGQSSPGNTDFFRKPTPTPIPTVPQAPPGN